MKKILLGFFLYYCSVFSQFSVTSFYPPDMSTSVPEISMLSVTFSADVDTNLIEWDYFQTNIDSIIFMGYSNGTKTLNFGFNLDPNSDYYFLVFGMPGSGGQILEAPAVTRFTTGPSFSGSTISGTVTGSGDITPDKSIVALSTRPLGDDQPAIMYAVIAQSNGSFIIPYVSNGIYYPLAAKDLNNDGMISPESGDALAIIDSISVEGTNISGIILPLAIPEPVPFLKAFTEADSIVKENYNPDMTLRMIEDSGNETEILNEFKFLYTSESLHSGQEISISLFSREYEDVSYRYEELIQYQEIDKTLLESSIDPYTIIQIVDAAGGTEFKSLEIPEDTEFNIHIMLADMRDNEFSEIYPGTGTYYWGIEYAYYINTIYGYFKYAYNKWLLSVESGEIAGFYTDVEDNQENYINKDFHLHQNYPNPFNPSTTISFDLKSESLIKLEIFNSLGEKIDVLYNGMMSTGTHNFQWTSGEGSGIYFYRLTVTGNDGLRKSQTEKMILLK